MEFDQYHELQLLEALESDAETSQADLAARVGVAVGTVNWYLKRWSTKGYVKIKRIGRWQWRYLLTPQGMAEKARLASKYVEASMMLYRRVRLEAQTLLSQAKQEGYTQVVIDFEGDIAEICYLTCLEMGVEVITTPLTSCPHLGLDGRTLLLTYPA